MKKSKIDDKGTAVTVLSADTSDYISITDIENPKKIKV